MAPARLCWQSAGAGQTEAIPSRGESRGACRTDSRAGGGALCVRDLGDVFSNRSLLESSCYQLCWRKRDPSDGRLQSEAKLNAVCEQQRQNLGPELISDPMPLLL